MKESEIKRAIEKIHWAFLGALDTIDRYNDIPTEHLEKTGNETEEAVKLVISLCDYMIDDGKMDLSEELQIIHDEAVKITCGKYGEIPKEAKTDKLQPLLSRILINIANIWVEIQNYWEWEEQKQEPATQAQNKADGSEKGTGMGNNTTANPETPPAAQETPKVAVLQPNTPNHVGRPTEDNFADTIADKYTIQEKADMIQEELQKAISVMTEPMAIFALFVECFNKEILKQCPNHKQALSLIDSKEMQKAYYRQFHNDLRKTYFDTESKYYELAETDIIQDNAISKYILQAEPTVKDLLLLLEPPATKKKARKGA